MLLAIACAFLIPQITVDPNYPMSSIAELVHYTGGGYCDCGSGTLIASSNGKGLLLTAAHVAGSKGAAFKVKWRKAEGQPVTDGVCVDILNHTGFDTDAALVLTDVPPGLTPVPFAPYDKDCGPWTNAGYGYGESKDNGNGRLWVSTSSETEMSDSGNKLFCNGLLVGGMSGGACIDSRGKLVGITNGSTDEFSIITSGPNVWAMVSRNVGGN